MFGGERIKITPLGGIEGVGHSCFLYESGNSAVVVDCGIKPQTFEERIGAMGEEFNFDPPENINALDNLRVDSIMGVITHAHLDHIGAVAQLVRRGIPVYLSSDSKRIMEKYSGNLKLPVGAKFRIFNDRMSVQSGRVEVSLLVALNHSIPGNYGVVLRAGKKTILHLGDFKYNGVNDEIEKTRGLLREVRQKVGRIDCLLLDVLNIDEQGFGFTPPEQGVFDEMEIIIDEKRGGRIFIAFFSSNLRRMKAVLNIARSKNRRVGVSGQAMAASYNLLTKTYPADQDGDIVLISGSQGEEHSGLARLAWNYHKTLRLRKGDVVVYSSRIIPGNEQGLREDIEELHSRGAIIYLHEGQSEKLGLSFMAEESFLHVSGHEARDGLLDAVETLKPEVVIPIQSGAEKSQILRDILGNRVKILRAGETLGV